MKHGHGWKGTAPKSDVGCGVWCGCPRVGTTSDLFFFMDLHWLGFDSHLTRQIRPKSSQIGSYRPKTETAEMDQDGQNRPKSALNHAETAKIGFEWDPNILNLSFLNFTLNICCFFYVFFFVLSFLPSSFFVL